MIRCDNVSKPKYTTAPQIAAPLFEGLHLFLTFANRSTHWANVRRASAQQRSLREERVTLRPQNPYPIVLGGPVTHLK